MVSLVRYEQDAEAPRHAHVEHQIFIAIEGEFEVQLGDETRMIGPGEAAVIPSWLPHRVVARNGPGYQIDIFCPPRQGLLDLLAAGDPDPAT
jgi:quercetin dioxygenase-like cupin family protein